MNKSKMILAITGGVIVLLVLAMAFMVWTASTARTAAYEGDDESMGLDDVVSKATTLSRKAIYPSADSVKEISADIEKLNTWKDDSEKLIAKGDRAFPETTPAAFKTFIVSDAKRLVDGFEFGPFKDYIVGGKMPEASELNLLQRQWDDVAAITEILLASGVKKLNSLGYAIVATPEVQEEQPKNKKNKKAKAKKGDEAKSTFAPDKQSYVFSFPVAPAGFIKIVNALETNDRFMVVEDFSFKRERDSIADALGADEKKDVANAAGGRRGRRRGRAVEEVQQKVEDEAAKNGIITDPLIDPPLVVTMTISVYDFKTLDEKKVEEKDED